MILTRRQGQRNWGGSRYSEPESFWASYSDMMAGLLMIFALTTVITLLDIGNKLLEPTERVMEWEQIISEIKKDQDLNEIENVKVDPNTGALIISEESLRFKFDDTKLPKEAEPVLRKAVPAYFNIIYRYPRFLNEIKLIEISGHTDREDNTGANPWFSRVRAGEVLNFLLKEPDMQPYRKLLKDKAMTAGYADTQYPVECGVEIQCAAARRVEITIRLDDAKVLKEFLDELRKIIE